jgi:hypothetical protein
MTDKQEIWLYALLCNVIIIGTIAFTTYLTIKGNKCIANAARIAIQYTVPVAEVLDLCR